MLLSVACSFWDHLPFLSSVFLRAKHLHFVRHTHALKKWIYTSAFPSSWHAVCVILKLVSCCSSAVMADASLSSFQAQQDHFPCCSRPVSVVTVAPCSAVQEDYWTGLEWCKRLGNYCGLVLAYWYFPIELNWIMRLFQGSTYGKLLFLNNTC